MTEPDTLPGSLPEARRNWTSESGRVESLKREIRDLEGALDMKRRHLAQAEEKEAALFRRLEELREKEQG